MKKILVLLVVMCCAGMALGDVVPNSQYDGWRGWNNHAPGNTWMDSWGNTGDWGGTLCDAAVAEFDRAAIQTAISNVGGAPYAAYLHIQVNSDNLAALGVARPIAGVFSLPNFPWGSATGTGTGFEVNVKANADGNNMHDETLPWSYSAVPGGYDLKIDVGQAMVDWYFAHPNANGFFISNANPDGSVNPGQRLDTYAGGSTFTLEIVPEPATMLLLGLGGLGVLIRRKR